MSSYSPRNYRQSEGVILQRTEITSKCLWNWLKPTPCYYCILSDNAKLQRLWFETWWRSVPHRYVTSGTVTWTVPTVSSACGWAWATSKILMFPRATFKSRNLLTKSTYRASQLRLALHRFCTSTVRSIRKETIYGSVVSDNDPYWESPVFKSRSQ